MHQPAVAPCAATSAPTGAEDDLRLALGPNAEPYVKLWRRSRRVWLTAYGSWCWWGFLIPLPWLFYRKLWAVGSVLVVLPILAEAVLGTGARAGFGLSALVGAFGMPLVLDRCRRKARRVQSLGLPAGNAIEYLRRAGGVSIPGAVFGFVLTLSYFTVVFGYTKPLVLPNCDDPAVTEVALAIARDSATSLGFDPADLRLEGIAEQDADDGRLCWAVLRSGSRRLEVAFAVTWQDKASYTIAVDLRKRGE